MKALLDEQLSPEIAIELRSRNLDVEAVSERAELRGSLDERVMEAAAGEGRAVVTNNIKDYRPIAANRLVAGKGHAGLILLPSTRSRARSAIQVLADEIEQTMLANPGGLRDSERWLVPPR